MTAYVFGRVENEEWSDREWKIVEPLLHQALAAEPSAAHQFVRALVSAEVKGRKVNRDVLATTIETMLIEHAPYGNASEVAWMLWASLTFKLSLSPTALKVVSGVNDSFVALLALDARERGLAPDLDPSVWSTFMTQESLDGENWLLAYEAGVRGWLPSVGTTNHITAHPEFSFLASRNVRFCARMRSISSRTLQKLSETDAASYSHDEDWITLLNLDDEYDDDDQDDPAGVEP